MESLEGKVKKVKRLAGKGLGVLVAGYIAAGAIFGTYTTTTPTLAKKYTVPLRVGEYIYIRSGAGGDIHGRIFYRTYLLPESDISIAMEKEKETEYTTRGNVEAVVERIKEPPFKEAELSLVRRKGKFLFLPVDHVETKVELIRPSGKKRVKYVSSSWLYEKGKSAKYHRKIPGKK